MKYLIALALVTLPVVAFSAEDGRYDADIYVSVGNPAEFDWTYDVTVRAKTGEPVDKESGADAEAEYYFKESIVRKVMANEPASYRAKFLIKTYGKAIAMPALIVVEGEPARFFTGDRDDFYIDVRLLVKEK